MSTDIHTRKHRQTQVTTIFEGQNLSQLIFGCHIFYRNKAKAIESKFIIHRLDRAALNGCQMEVNLRGPCSLSHRVMMEVNSVSK